MAEREKLSLYGAVAEHGYEASVIATYAVSFPLYERVVLRRLQAAGCRHNILIADAGQCGRQMESAAAMPQFCGSDYLLLPIRAAASFHPKFILLIGRQRARLLVGSHNLTFAGFGARAARKLDQYAARKVIHVRDVDSTLPDAGGGRTFRS